MKKEYSDTSLTIGISQYETHQRAPSAGILPPGLRRPYADDSEPPPETQLTIIRGPVRKCVQWYARRNAHSLFWAATLHHRT